MSPPDAVVGQSPLDRSLAHVGLALVFFGVVFVAPWAVDAYGVAKLVLVALGVGALAVVWARNPVVPQALPVRVAVIAFVVALIAATVAAPSWRVAVHGSFRYMGALSLLLMIVAAFAGAALYDAVEWDRLRIAVVVGSVGIVGIIALSSFLEVVDASPLSYNQTFAGRAQSVFGNPAVTAGAVLLVTPVAAFSTESRFLRGAMLLLGGAALWLSGTRSAWIAAVAVAAALAALRLGRRALLGAGAVLGLGVVAATTSGRWSTVLGDAAGRFELWEIGVRALRRSPLVGYGPDGFGAAFGTFVRPGDDVALDRGQVVDRAHQAAIDIGLSVGTLGAVAVVVLWIGIGYLAVRSIRMGDTWTIAISAGLVGYLIHQQLLFPVPSTDVLFWLLAGLLAAAHCTFVPVRLSTSVALVLPLLVVPALWSYTTASIADAFDKRGSDTAIAVDAMSAFEAANRIRPDMTQRAVLVATRFQSVPSAEILERAITVVDRQLAVIPDDPVVPMSAATLKTSYYQLTGSDEVLLEVVDSMRKIVGDDPLNGEAHLKLGTALYYLDEFDLARGHWERAEVLLPGSTAPGDNLAVLDDQ